MQLSILNAGAGGAESSALGGRADINKDNKLSAVDLTLLKRMLAK